MSCILHHHTIKAYHIYTFNFCLIGLRSQWAYLIVNDVLYLLSVCRHLPTPPLLSLLTPHSTPPPSLGSIFTFTYTLSQWLVRYKWTLKVVLCMCYQWTKDPVFFLTSNHMLQKIFLLQSIILKIPFDQLQRLVLVSQIYSCPFWILIFFTLISPSLAMTKVL